MLMFLNDCRDEDGDQLVSELGQNGDKNDLLRLDDCSGNPFLSLPDPNTPAVEYKKGYVMRKCCLEMNGKRSKYKV